MHIHTRKVNNGRYGFITLISVIVMVAVSSALAVSVILLGLDSMRTGQTINESNEAVAIADACAEEALEQIRTNDLIGAQAVTVGNGECSYTIQDEGGEARRIEVTATAYSVTRRILVTTSTRTPDITITSWRDVASF
jgi:mitochondrial fission protein ELM1